MATDPFRRKIVTDDEARDWFHRSRPGGMARDWINNAAIYGDLDSLHLAATAALLWAAGSIHVCNTLDIRGERMGTHDYRKCILCVPALAVEPTESYFSLPDQRVEAL